MSYAIRGNPTRLAPRPKLVYRKLKLVRIFCLGLRITPLWVVNLRVKSFAVKRNATYAIHDPLRRIHVPIVGTSVMSCALFKWQSAAIRSSGLPVRNVNMIWNFNWTMYRLEVGVSIVRIVRYAMILIASDVLWNPLRLIPWHLYGLLIIQSLHGWLPGVRKRSSGLSVEIVIIRMTVRYLY